MTETEPLVSCIMPTYNRREFVPNAIRYYLRQLYGNKELIIIDDGTDIIKDLIPDNPTIRYIHLSQKISLGAKLNLACKNAIGTIIANWDDDDWYADWRLKYQVESLQNSKTGVNGINNLLYYDLDNRNAFKYIYPSDQRTWLLGSSLCYSKELWSRNQFADINVGMDGLFVWKAPPDAVAVLPDFTFSVHMIHNTNVSPKKTDGVWWHPYKVAEIQKLMGDDWFLYRNNRPEPLSTKINGFNVKETTLLDVKDTLNALTSPLKNVYACLVHENENCVTDLVSNLHYQDPSSTILLYNGGENPGLIQNHFPYEKYGAIVHPKPIPVKHGYLHNFAICCMQFAIENFPFDTLTIVDSDQLSIRCGYSGYLSEFFASQSNIGMLSSNAEQVTRDNITNKVAIQAFQEYDLWKPLLQTFPDGENKFIHWTFWPSTVFTNDAIRDLVKLFNENLLLQNIMEHTKIWASEEVILPTLIRLLGYDILTNPCSYDFVKYRKAISIGDIRQALKKKDVYWVHPIRRNFEDPVRKYVRDQFHQYSVEKKQSCDKASLLRNLFNGLPLINKIRKIEGWLSDGEAELLISITLKACKTLPSPYTIVEIGSYHGKSTILFGGIIKELRVEGKIHAIDPHDGKLGAEDTGLQTFPPSWEMFKRNIESHGLSDVVEMIRNNSYNVNWQTPVSLLFVDGLHDYSNVARDFRHFSEWIVTGGYVAFHDYADYFPGVKKFVDELLKTGMYRQIKQVYSLIILQKL